MTEIHKPGVGAIFGIVTEEGIAKDNSPVYLYDNRRYLGTGKKRLLSLRHTRPDGGFEFAGLNTNYDDYMVLATDEDGEEPKNALVQDRVTPVPAHSGSGGLSEWYIQASKDGAQVGWLGYPVIDDGATFPTPRGINAAPLGLPDAPHSWGVHSEPPAEYPNLGSLETNDVGWYVAFGKRGNAHNNASLEFLIDLDAIAALSGRQGFVLVESSRDTNSAFRTTTERLTGSSSWQNSNLGQLRLGVYFNPNKTVTVYIKNNFSTDHWAASSALIATFDLSAFSGYRHIIITHSAAVNTQCWVDGVLEDTVATALFSSSTALQNGSGPTMLAMVDYLPSAVGSNVLLARGHRNQRQSTLALVVGYMRALSAQEILRHYKALYDNDLISTESGYAREVLVDMPSMYWRFNDYLSEEREYFSSVLHWRDPNTGAGFAPLRLNRNGQDSLIGKSIPSPVAGQNTVHVTRGNSNFFSGGYGTAGWLFRKHGAVSFWAKFDEAEPAATGNLISLARVYYPTNYYFRVNRLVTSGRFQVQLFEVGTTVSYTFSGYDPPVDVWLNVYIVIDKTGDEDPANGLLKLYVGTETVAPELKDTVLITLSDLYTSEVARAAPSGQHDHPSCAVRTHENFSGSLCEFAVFPSLLTPARIEAHWNARTVV